MIPSKIQKLIDKAYPTSIVLETEDQNTRSIFLTGQTGQSGQVKSYQALPAEKLPEIYGTGTGQTGQIQSPWAVEQVAKLIKKYPDHFDLWREFYAWVDRKCNEGYTTDYLLACEALLMGEWEASRHLKDLGHKS